jgi:hypothetical protein
MIFRQCQSSGCLHRAQYVAKLMIPPKGFPIEANKNLSIIIGVPLCEDHLVICVPEQFLNRQTYAIVDAFTKGKVSPDYERAFILPVDMDSNEYHMWERQRNKGKTQ